MNAGKDIAMTAAANSKKSLTHSYNRSNHFQVATLGAAGKTLFNKSFAILKDKREQALLRERLGLTREEFGQMKKQKAVLDAQKKYNDEFNSATKNLLGFDADKIRSALVLGMKENSIVPSIEKLISTTQTGIDKEEFKTFASQRGAAKRVEADNEKMRKEEETQSIFHSIAAGIDNPYKRCEHQSRRRWYGSTCTNWFDRFNNCILCWCICGRS